ncbi:MAG: hypothetical protein MJA83_04150 [Gammaproteobacteria bacterium]|nr:hypothetical protein [Gammaproteobacteria bacterium]
MSFVKSADIRVTREFKPVKRDRVVRANLRFLRRTAEMRIDRLSSKEDLVAEIWSLYFGLCSADLLEAPLATRSALRERYGIWTQVDVERTN